MSDVSCHSLTLLGHGHMLLCCAGGIISSNPALGRYQKLPVEA
ncbi:hypothetical protein [Paenibacillus amylolyticus]